VIEREKRLNSRCLFHGPTSGLLAFPIPGTTPGGREEGILPEGKTGPAPLPLLSLLLPPPVDVGTGALVPVPVAVLVPAPAPIG